MGYTHYWRRPQKMDKKRWNSFIKEVEMLKDNLPTHGITADCSYTEPIVLADGMGEEEGNFTISKDEILFNGLGDMPHEGVHIPRVLETRERNPNGRAVNKKAEPLHFAFCKTARKPYDTFVCLVLISMKRWFSHGVLVSSDGNEKDWAPALELYNKLTQAHFPTFEILMHDPEEEKEKA